MAKGHYTRETLLGARGALLVLAHVAPDGRTAASPHCLWRQILVLGGLIWQGCGPLRACAFIPKGTKARTGVVEVTPLRAVALDGVSRMAKGHYTRETLLGAREWRGAPLLSEYEI